MTKGNSFDTRDEDPPSVFLVPALSAAIILSVGFGLGVLSAELARFFIN
ncbi:hypothetical protein TRICHSKD4_2725 [Roseibium sp. TrichSKD4]|nr:hypothetical protein [Roseibium sp. TrichSKD4]EFO31638.1 hypothetical protein TRICHSKD4_2725 [Roseibium sp. TrichSKD4]